MVGRDRAFLRHEGSFAVSLHGGAGNLRWDVPFALHDKLKVVPIKSRENTTCARKMRVAAEGFMRNESRRQFLKSSMSAVCATALAGTLAESLGAATTSPGPLPIKKGILLD